jgi:hypothetical protein
MSIKTAELNRFLDFVVERHHVSLRKERGDPWPWTQDTILQTYRFCNVYRERDKVTRYIRTKWVPRHLGKTDSWFVITVARLLNWPDTLDALPEVSPWQPQVFTKALGARMAAGQQVFGPAYIVSTNGVPMPKHEYLAHRVLTPLWEARDYVRPRNEDTLQSFHARLMEFQGLGSFMAAQVVADVKNTKNAGLDPPTTPDWMTWAAPGPGSLRGLNRLLGNGAKKSGISEARFLQEVNLLRTAVNARFTRLAWESICAQDLQNCLCEYDKYERVRLGEGKPKQGYVR